MPSSRMLASAVSSVAIFLSAPVRASIENRMISLALSLRTPTKRSLWALASMVVAVRRRMAATIAYSHFMPCPFPSTASEPRDESRLNDLPIELVGFDFRIAPLVGVVDVPAPIAADLIAQRGL